MGSNTASPDHNVLDDTLAGRLTQAGIAGVSVALPDYIDSRLGRAAVNLAVAAGGTALVSYLNSRDDDPDNDPSVIIDRIRQSAGDIGSEQGPASDTPPGDFDLDSPVRTWLVLGAALLVVILLLRLDAAGRRWFVRKLGERGIRRPHSVLGAITFAVVFLISEAADRGRRAEA